MTQSPKPDYVSARWADKPPTLLISTIGECQLFFHTCPHAQTYEAYSLTLQATVWIPLPCKQWSCRKCAEFKISSLARRCSSALPNRLLTLTIDPALWEDPRQSFDGTRRHVPELVRQLRRKFGEVEYLRVTELTSKGWPHYHCLVRSGFLPHSVVRDRWRELTGASIVDLRKVEDRFKTYLYLVKYLAKMHNLGWTNRHVSYSKNFFKDPPREKTDPLQLSEGKVLETHPATLAYHQFRNSELCEVSYGVFTLQASDELKRAATSPDGPSAEEPIVLKSRPSPVPPKPPPPSPPHPFLFSKDPQEASPYPS